MTFNEFVEQVSQDNLTQFAFDLAGDWKSDQSKPDVKNKKEAKNYLISNNACKEALEGLDDLWDAYKKAKDQNE